MKTRDWTGNSKAIYSCHGASNHSDTERGEPTIKWFKIRRNINE